MLKKKVHRGKAFSVKTISSACFIRVDADIEHDAGILQH
jgi:hypothetical protein